jgi:hypothetical protein
MSEQPSELMSEQPSEPAPGKPNAGWFKPGDRRINREGRPRGSRKAAQGTPAAVLAPKTDRLVLVPIPAEKLASQLSSPWDHSFISNWGEGQIVGACMDEQGTVYLTLRSERFRRVVKGAPIPVGKPRWR